MTDIEKIRELLKSIHDLAAEFSRDDDRNIREAAKDLVYRGIAVSQTLATVAGKRGYGYRRDEFEGIVRGNDMS